MQCATKGVLPEFLPSPLPDVVPLVWALECIRFFFVAIIFPSLFPVRFRGNIA